MKMTKASVIDGTARPRRWAIHTPNGSIDAEKSATASILRGVVGRIIEPTRITIVIHDTWPPIVAMVSDRACVLIRATAAALATMNINPTSAFSCDA